MMINHDPEFVITLQRVIEFIGTFAFALSGIRLAASKHYDWLGGFVCGIAVAIGGGTIRDVMLGVRPFWPNRLAHGAWHPLDTDALKMVPTRIYAWAPYLVLAERSCYSAASSSSETSNSKSLPGRMALSTIPTSEPTARPESEIVTPPSSSTMAPTVL